MPGSLAQLQASSGEASLSSPLGRCNIAIATAIDKLEASEFLDGGYVNLLQAATGQIGSSRLYQWYLTVCNALDSLYEGTLVNVSLDAVLAMTGGETASSSALTRWRRAVSSLLSTLSSTVVPLLLTAPITVGPSDVVAALTVPYADDPAVILGSAPALWLDAYQGTLESPGNPCEDGDPVTIWENVGGADFTDFTEATNPPTFRATGGNGGRPAVEFDGLADKMNAIISGTASGDSWYCIFVAKCDTQNSRSLIDCSDTTAPNRGITIFFSVTPLLTFRWGNAAGNNNATGTPSGPGVWKQWEFEGATASRTEYEEDVALIGGTNPEITARAISAVVNAILGALNVATPLFFFDGMYGEVIMFKGPVTAAQRAALKARGDQKWGTS